MKKGVEGEIDEEFRISGISLRNSGMTRWFFGRKRGG
jgi:hypothetical protein